MLAVVYSLCRLPRIQVSSMTALANRLGEKGCFFSCQADLKRMATSKACFYGALSLSCKKFSYPDGKAMWRGSETTQRGIRLILPFQPFPTSARPTNKAVLDPPDQPSCQLEYYLRTLVDAIWKRGVIQLSPTCVLDAKLVSYIIQLFETLSFGIIYYIALDNQNTLQV